MLRSHFELDVVTQPYIISVLAMMSWGYQKMKEEYQKDGLHHPLLPHSDPMLASPNFGELVSSLLPLGRVKGPMGPGKSP